ncbi:MAG: mannose-1-phosphate guanylyltransferase/mannose-6-phosphate isomerase [Wolinella sp.]
MTTVILCGGSGSRLWPISRNLMPKQFIELFDGESLFQKTLLRNKAHSDKFVIVTSIDQQFLAQTQVNNTGIDGVSYLLEGSARNTAPAISLASLMLDPDEVMLVVPSDHLIKDLSRYYIAIEHAKNLALKGHIVTFGIKPSYPESGYGYIEGDISIQYENWLKVKSFKEKPDIVTAKQYVESGVYFWNSGMFCFKACVLLDELSRHANYIKESCEKIYKEANKTDSVINIRAELMDKIPSESIDYALMEHSKNVYVVPCDMGWSDLGSFESLSDELPKDECGNTKNDAIKLDCYDNLIIQSERKLALIDVSNLMVIDTPDALLIAQKGSGQRVKEVVNELKRTNSELHNTHLTVYRPWGLYTTLEEGDKYKIKRIVVDSGARLSLQKHIHRSEHWVIVSGVGMVQIGDKEELLKANESTYIPAGEIHRLSNPGKLPLILIETQVGDYLGEDDIIRIEDDYARD